MIEKKTLEQTACPQSPDNFSSFDNSTDNRPAVILRSGAVIPQNTKVTPPLPKKKTPPHPKKTMAMAMAMILSPVVSSIHSVDIKMNQKCYLLHTNRKNEKNAVHFVALSSKASSMASPCVTEPLEFLGIDKPSRIREQLLKLCTQNKLEEALDVLHIMDQRVILPDSVIYDTLLQVCSDNNSFLNCKKVYNHIVKNPSQWNNVYLKNKVMRVFLKSGSLEDARHVFDKMSQREVYSWGVIISAYVNYGLYEEALELFLQMQEEGMRPDGFVIGSVVNACAGVGELQLGEEMHGYVFKCGYGRHVFVGNCLVGMYCKCGSSEGARAVFDQMYGRRDKVSWNSMIAGYIQNGNLDEALRLFLKMHLEGIKPDVVSWSTIIVGCARGGYVSQALGFFHQMQSQGVKPDLVSYHAIIVYLCQTGLYDEAMEVFRGMQAASMKMDVFSWTSLISGCLRQGHCEMALEIFRKMQEAGGIQLDSRILLSLLTACAGLSALQLGKEAHGYIIKSGFDTDVFIDNAIIDMYAKCGSVEDAHRVFARIAERDMVSWNVMIACYAQNGHVDKAEELFRQLKLKIPNPDVISWNTMIAGYAQNGHLDEAVELFQKMLSAGINPDGISWGSLILGYAQIGKWNECQQLFCQMQVEGVKPNANLWNSLIVLHVENGHDDEALSLFHQMQLAGAKPESYALTNIIQVCAKLGVLEQGKQIHGLIIRLGIEVVACAGISLVAMYSECGAVEDAYRVLEKISKRNRAL